MDESKERSFKRTANFGNIIQIVQKSTRAVNFKEQIEKAQSRYEKWIYELFSQAEEEE